MSIYSNVTPEQMADILANITTNAEPRHVVIHVDTQPTTACKYAQDTGEIAFVRAPCRGNKIICKKISGHVSFAKACNSEFCKYFEQDRKN